MGRIRSISTRIRNSAEGHEIPASLQHAKKSAKSDTCNQLLSEQVYGSGWFGRIRIRNSKKLAPALVWIIPRTKILLKLIFFSVFIDQGIENNKSVWSFIRLDADMVFTVVGPAFFFSRVGSGSSPPESETLALLCADGSNCGSFKDLPCSYTTFGIFPFILIERI